MNNSSGTELNVFPQENTENGGGRVEGEESDGSLEEELTSDGFLKDKVESDGSLKDKVASDGSLKDKVASDGSLKEIAEDGEVKIEEPKQSLCGRFVKWLSSTNALLYISHTFSAWGDRMWQFATGMFLIALQPESLRLTATYTFTSGGAVLLLGPIVGNWVDKYPRLTMARGAIIVQNLGVALSAVIVCLTVQFHDQISVTWNGWLLTVCEIFIIMFGVIGDVASIGRTIAIEKDWIVVICKDKHKLTSMSALLRRIDLTTKLVAPVLTGQIITYGSMFIGAVFIACWNIMSMFAEYYLLLRVYKSVPQLANKGKLRDQDDDEDEEDIKEPEATEGTSLVSDHEKDIPDRDPECSHSRSVQMSMENLSQISQNSTSGVKECCLLFLKSFVVVARGWKTYWSQSILLAGMSLSAAYMTVLGFDNITAAFAKDQGLTESVVGILQSVGALFGVCGTLLFPVLRRRMGIKKTGILAFLLLLCCLTPCVVSVFAPGSPFDPHYLSNRDYIEGTGDEKVNNTTLRNITNGFAYGDRPSGDEFSYSYCVAPLQRDSENGTISTANGSYVGSDMLTVMPQTNCSVTPTAESNQTSESYWSVALLMGGIVIARTGLWMSDLSVTQLLLETPAEHERGIVNGVQNSLNQFMDLIKSLLVILLPWPQTFGFLIIASFTSICLSNALFISYVCRSKKR